VPDRGDIVWLQSDPQAGHEQAGHRPAFVVSPRAYNRKVGLDLFCPITSRVKGYPFEVPLPATGKAHGAILADQLRVSIGGSGKRSASTVRPRKSSAR